LQLFDAIAGGADLAVADRHVQGGGVKLEFVRRFFYRVALAVIGLVTRFYRGVFQTTFRWLLLFAQLHC